MELANIQTDSQTGDLLLVEGNGLFAILIRVLTGQQISHVAVLTRSPQQGLRVWDMTFKYGCCDWSLKDWLEIYGKTGYVYLGQAPAGVRRCPGEVLQAVTALRGSKYRWIDLPKVWLAQILRKRVPARGFCSALIQKAWEASGFLFSQTADPGDFVRLCRSLSIVDEVV
jgi:hypothetical protein